MPAKNPLDKISDITAWLTIWIKFCVEIVFALSLNQCWDWSDWNKHSSLHSPDLSKVWRILQFLPASFILQHQQQQVLLFQMTDFVDVFLPTLLLNITDTQTGENNK